MVVLVGVIEGWAYAGLTENGQHHSHQEPARTRTPRLTGRGSAAVSDSVHRTRTRTTRLGKTAGSPEPVSLLTHIHTIMIPYITFCRNYTRCKVEISKVQKTS